MKIPHLGKKDLLPFLIYLYLFLPFVLFLIGWTKPIVSIPVLIVLAVCLYRMVKSFPELWLPKISRENIFNIGFILFVIFVWVYFSGIGGFVAQNSDHHYRNGIFETLVAEKWPVINFSTERFGQPTALVYYFGFWLPAAIIGKLFGLTAGYIAQIIWASIGISTPIREITRTTTYTATRMRNNETIELEPKDPLERDVYRGYIKDNIFFDYLARRNK